MAWRSRTVGRFADLRNTFVQTDAQIVDRSAAIHFTFIVFLPLVVISPNLWFVRSTLYNVQETHFVSLKPEKVRMDEQRRPAARIWQSNRLLHWLTTRHAAARLLTD